MVDFIRRGLGELRWAWPAIVVVFAWGSIRTAIGLDFSDEFQYYGQIDSLLRHGRLFEADLFFQQIVYVFFFPAFWVHRKLAGVEYFVLYGRFLFSLALFASVLVHLYHFRRVAGGTGYVALAASLAVFGPAYHNIFAISYNTVGQILLAVILVLWVSRGSHDTLTTRSGRTLGVLLGVLAWVHPVAALGALLVVEGDRLLGGDFRLFSGVSLASGATFAGLGAMMIVLGIFSLDGLLESLAFSRAFGVGDAISGRGQVLLLGVLVLPFLMCMLAFRFRKRFDSHRSAGWIIGGALLVAAVAISRGTWQVAMAWGTAGLLAWTVVRGRDSTRGYARVTMFAVVVGIGLAVTSGNGAVQFVGATFLALPYAVLGACEVFQTTRASSRFKALSCWSVCAVSIALTAHHFMSRPYRDLSIYENIRAGQRIHDVPAMKGLLVSPQKAELVIQARRQWSDLKDLRLLVVGPHPWLYFATQSIPETKMFFFHFAGNESAFDLLSRKISGLVPDVILITTRGGERHVQAAIEQLVRRRSMQCQDRVVPGTADPGAVTWERKVTECRIDRG